MSQPAKSQFSQIEEEMLQVWQKEKTFEQSLKQREGKPYFSFYDGPPFANGLPHYGHVVPSTIKDAIARYKTMQGFYVPRKAGWDTHGLPVEYEVEKQLGISGKKQILALGVEKFNQACRDSVFRYKGEFEAFIRRLGRWIDLDHAYATLDDDYIESVWWVLSELHKKKLLYQGFRSMPYCPRCATPLSNFELNQGYQDNVEDPSVFAVFPLSNDLSTGFLSWTTTPWTLPANAALAVDDSADYVTVELKKPENINVKRLILAKRRLSELELRQSEYKIVKTQKGSELVGVGYEPLYKTAGITVEQEKTVHKVYADKSVSLEDGTGILHVAPRYGETDLLLGQRESLPLLESVDSNGMMTTEPGKGLFFKEADPLIIADLTVNQRIFAAETFTHTYPFCWRCDSPLLYFATPSWFVKVTSIVEDLVKTNQAISWVPKHIKQGRFGNWLAEARDWGISRNRFWGAPLPIWVNKADPDDFMVIGSLEELKRLSDGKNFDLHRPGIDKVVIKKDGNTYQRVEAVFDCWFESGAMPYAQDHYPFEHEADFKKGFPADFISEGLDQTRGWFYTLHVLATGLFNQPAYKNVICHGIVVAADGKKLSKRLRNYPPLEEVFESYGADALRFFMLNSPVVVGESVRFGSELLKDVQRNVFMTLWNCYTFYNTYTLIDKWQPKETQAPTSDHILDRWILARLQETIEEVTKQADNYRLDRATDPLVGLVDDLSNWYIRRSRRRFWKSEDDQDKIQAYATLHHVLLVVSQLFAPWAPFLSDKMYRQLAKGTKSPASVHLSDWPKASKPDKELLASMKQARDYINQGLSLRATAKVKVRQPLQLARVPKLPEKYRPIIAEELNVKEVEWSKNDNVTVQTKLTQELILEGLARDLIRQIQSARKQAGLEVENRIRLHLSSKNLKVGQAIKSYGDLIKQETLTQELSDSPLKSFSTEVRLEGDSVNISLAKVD